MPCALQLTDPGSVLLSFTRDDVDIISRETGFKGFYRLDVLNLRHRLFNGGWGPVLRRELLVRHDAVCVLPYDPWLDQVVLIEQVRIGALEKSDNPWMLELVAGLIDTDESPEEVAAPDYPLLPVTRWQRRVCASVLCAGRQPWCRRYSRSGRGRRGYPRKSVAARAGSARPAQRPD